MTDKNLPPNFYLASYLKKAGIRFEVNVVDTVIAKGLGIGSYIIVLLLLFFNCSGLFKISLNNFYFVAVNLLGVLYLLYVFIRLFYFYAFAEALYSSTALSTISRSFSSSRALTTVASIQPSFTPQSRRCPLYIVA